MGIGLGLGINDFELIKKSFRNLGVATIFSVLTSTLYFLISPLNEAGRNCWHVLPRRYMMC